MTACHQLNSFEEHAWILGDREDLSALSPTHRRLWETKIAAAIFKRRSRLLIHWRRQSLTRRRNPAPAGQIKSSPVSRLHRATADDDIGVTTNLPRHMPILRDELAILRGFLSREIDHILFGDE